MGVLQKQTLKPLFVWDPLFDKRQNEPFKDKKIENMKTYESGSTLKFPIFEMGSLYSGVGKLKTLKTGF